MILFINMMNFNSALGEMVLKIGTYIKSVLMFDSPVWVLILALR